MKDFNKSKDSDDFYDIMTDSFLGYCRTPDLTNSPVQPLIGKSGRLYIRTVVWLVMWLVVWLVGCLFVCHGRDSSDVTLAFEDAQLIQALMDDE